MGANPLSRLIRQADAASETASVLLKRTIREIRHDLADLPPSLNLAGSAEDREKAYNLVRRRFARLSRMLDGILADANTAAAKAAAKAAGQMTGLEVKYSPSRAKAICELVTPAQGENLAAVFTDKMAVQLINSLREATVATLRDQAVIGGTLKDMKRDLADRWALAAKVENPTFTDASGRRWDTQTYFQMNVRTNAMRVYNDCLVDDVAREVGTDVMRISTGGDPDCACAAWEGCIISVSGKTKGLPTYEDARRGGCFHPNCTHTLEYVDEVADADEIALQKDHPAQKGLEDDPDAQDERKYEIDQDRYRRTEGLSAEDARVAVDRDNLTDAIRFGLVRDDAREIVDGMTDAQVTALCRNGNPPTFEPTKKGQEERWNHGSKGGVVHIARNETLGKIVDLCNISEHEILRDRVAGYMRGERGKDWRGADFGGASKETIDEIESAIGVLPTKNALSVATSDLYHLKKHYGENEHYRNQTGTTDEDLALFVDFLNDHDSIAKGNSGFRNGKQHQTIIVKSTRNGFSYSAVYVISSKIYPKSMWKKKVR